MGTKDKERDHYNGHRRSYDKSESREFRKNNAYDKDLKKNLVHKSNSYNSDSDKHNKYKDKREDRHQGKNGLESGFLKTGNSHYDKRHNRPSPRNSSNYNKDDSSKNPYDNRDKSHQFSYLGKRSFSSHQRNTRSGRFANKDESPHKYSIKKKRGEHDSENNKLIQWIKGEKLCMTRYFSKHDEPFGTLMTEDEFVDVKDKILKDMMDRAKEAEMNNKIQFESLYAKKDERYFQQKLSSVSETIQWFKPIKIAINSREFLNPLGKKSGERIRHARRIEDKLACFYARDYQIPDAPKLVLINNHNTVSTEPKTIVIRFTPPDATAPQIGEKQLKTEKNQARLEIRNKLKKVPKKGILKSAVHTPLIESSCEQNSEDFNSRNVFNRVESNTKRVSYREIKTNYGNFTTITSIFNFLGIHVEQRNHYKYLEEVINHLGGSYLNYEESPYKVLVNKNLELIKKMDGKLHEKGTSNLTAYMNKFVYNNRPVLPKARNESKF